jgi:hypothetical protein
LIKLLRLFALPSTKSKTSSSKVIPIFLLISTVRIDGKRDFNHY